MADHIRSPGIWNMRAAEHNVRFNMYVQYMYAVNVHAVKTPYLKVKYYIEMNKIEKQEIK